MIIPFLPIYLLELGVPKADVALWSGLVFGLPSLLLVLWRLYGAKLQIIKGKKRMALRWFCHCCQLCPHRYGNGSVPIVDGACLGRFCQRFLSCGDDHGFPER